MATARRLRTGTAKARGTSSTQTGSAQTRVTASHRGEPYHETSQNHTGSFLERTFMEGEEPAFVRFAAGVTINLGDFNSLRIDSSVTLPCLPVDIDEAHQIAADFVADKIADEEFNWVGSNKRTAKRR